MRPPLWLLGVVLVAAGFSVAASVVGGSYAGLAAFGAMLILFTTAYHAAKKKGKS
jgi:hypothetical protein